MDRKSLYVFFIYIFWIFSSTYCKIVHKKCISIQHSHNCHIHRDECASIRQPLGLHWPPCEWTFTLLKFPVFNVNMPIMRMVCKETHSLNVLPLQCAVSHNTTCKVITICKYFVEILYFNQLSIIFNSSILYITVFTLRLLIFY